MPSLFDDDWEKNLKQVEEKNKKAANTKNIAMEKAGLSEFSSGNKSKTDKITGRGNKKNFFQRLAVAVIPQSVDEPKEKARKIFLMAAVVCLLVALGYLCWQIVQLAQGREANFRIAGLAGLEIDNPGNYSSPGYLENPNLGAIGPGTGDPEFIDLTPVVNVKPNPNFYNLKAQNPDTVAWIKIQGTALNNVVVRGTDNSYYLTHNFYGEESISGTIFSSYLNKWDGTDDNNILFGHNMASGDFFAYVIHYFPNDYSSEPIAFYKTHPTIMLSTPDNGCEVYKIFAGILVNTESQYGEIFPYTSKTRFSSQSDFNNFILDVMDRSWFFTDVDLTYGDKLLTLSTCYWPLGRSIETRWVIFARKVRPGESEEVDTSVAYRNYNPKLFEYYYSQIRGSWAGRVWDTSKLLSY